MVALICFVLAVLALPFKSKSRLEAENAGAPTSADRFATQGEREGPAFEQRSLVLRPALSLVSVETLARWHRDGFRRYWRWKSRSRGGRPQIETELRALIRQMSVENLLWGAPRIHGELLKLGFEIAQSSVAKYMVNSCAPPSQGWS